MKRCGFLFIAFLIAISSCPAWATMYEYSDAVGHGTASHSTGEWQRLGTMWDIESGPNPNDSSDDGVVWTTDGGSTYGGDLVRGQDVTFEFDMRRAPYGNHDYDQIKVWVDWDGDLQFESTEVILAEQWWKGDTKIDDTVWKTNNGYDSSYKYDYPANPPANLQKTFEVTWTVPDDAALGDIWLRARVQCNHVPFDTMTPYGELWQGEVEDWQLNVVPVPPGIILAGIGMAVAGWRLKRKESLAG